MKKIFTPFLFAIILSTSFGCSISDMGDILSPKSSKVPDTPVNLAVSVSNDTVFVNWDSVRNATGYKVFTGTSPGIYENSADTGNATSKVFSNVPNNTYYIAVKASNEAGISPQSSELSVTVDLVSPVEPSAGGTDTGVTDTGATCASSTSIGSTGKGGGFVWKPISAGNGNLVVLIPSSYTGNTRTDLKAVKSNGEVIETGSYKGPSNGNRETYRFSGPGAAYGNGIYVVVTLSDCSIDNWYIPAGSDRKEY